MSALNIKRSMNTMVTVNIQEATPTQINWLVAKCEEVTGLHVVDKPGKACVYADIGGINFPYQPSTDWSQGGPIIEREGIELKRGYGKPLLWAAFAYDCHSNVRRSTGRTGPTPLIAAMRCYVASKMGAEVEVPKELTK